MIAYIFEKHQHSTVIITFLTQSSTDFSSREKVNVTTTDLNMDKIHLANGPPCKMPMKANEGSMPGSSGALRYALHLRFLSPAIKKKGAVRSVQRTKSDCSSAVVSEMEERRYYLYNDFRVVFPQRHSDSDEGKVCKSFLNVLPPYYVVTMLCHVLLLVRNQILIFTSGSKFSPFLSLGFQLKVEHHFPADPKYFDISN